MFHPRVILAPTDFSDYSKCAFDVAIDLARQNQARLLALHVVDTLGAEDATYGEVTTHLEPDHHRGLLLDDLSRHTRTIAGDFPVESLLAEGEPAREIDRIVRERHCDLVVMATHGRSGLKRLLMGSVAEQVIRIVPCPVLICKLPPEAASSH
jgi:universal stress protein A